MLGVLGLATLGAPSESNAGKKYENKQGRDNFSTTATVKNCLTTKKFETVRFHAATKVALMQCLLTGLRYALSSTFRFIALSRDASSRATISCRIAEYWLA